jgi:hypothetical protein
MTSTQVWMKSPSVAVHQVPGSGRWVVAITAEDYADCLTITLDTPDQIGRLGFDIIDALNTAVRSRHANSTPDPEPAAPPVGAA